MRDAHQTTDGDVALTLLDLGEERNRESTLACKIRQPKPAFGTELPQPSAELFGRPRRLRGGFVRFLVARSQFRVPSARSQ